MGREHIVIGGDDADIRGAAGGQRRLVFAHRRISMGLIAAGQMRAARASLGRCGHAGQIGRTARLAPLADPLGHIGDGCVKRHSRLRNLKSAPTSTDS